MIAPRPVTSAAGDPRVVAALEEYLAAASGGPRPDRAEFLARHAEIADALADCLDGLDFVQGAASSSAGDGPGTDSGAIPPASSLGDFRIARELGRGGMGIVYEAEQVSLGRRVALKVLPFAAAIDPRRIRRFQVEAQAAAQLHHPHIVPIFAVGCDRGVHYYAMQFIEGRTLADVVDGLARSGGVTADPPADGVLADDAPGGSAPATAPGSGPLPAAAGGSAASSTASATGSGAPRAVRARFRAVARLGIQAAEALDHAHGLGVLHRDIKPANLMIDLAGDLWITDFGLARFQEDVGLTRSGDLVGTLRYMSPEQAGAEGAIVDQRADIYALGATLYELAALRPAFDARDRRELLHRVTLDEPTAPRRLDPTIPRDLETIILKAMSKDPAARYASARELADDLRRFQEHKPIRARRPTPPEHLAKWARRHRAAVAAASITLVLAMAVASALLWGQQRQTARALTALEAIREKERSALPGILMDVDRLMMATMQRFSEGRRFAATPEDRPFFEMFLRNYEGLVVLTAGDADPRMREVGAKAFFGRGLARMFLGRPGAEESFRESIAAYESLLRELPARADLEFYRAASFKYLGEALYRSGGPSAAEPAFADLFATERALIRRDPDSADYRAYLVNDLTRWGQLLLAAGRRPEAEGALAQAVEADPARPGTLNDLAWLLASRPDLRPYDPARALGLAERAVGLDPERADYWNTLGMARLRNDRPDAAEAFERSLRQRSANPALDWFPLAVLHARRGDMAEARRLYDRAVAWAREHGPDDAELLYFQSEARSQLGLTTPADSAPPGAARPGPARPG